MAKSTTQTFNEEDKGDLNERLILKKGYRKIELYALVMNFHFMLHVMMYTLSKYATGFKWGLCYSIFSFMSSVL